MNFGGKSILVTAGASGIGRAIAQGFLSAEADVHIVDIDERAAVANSKKHPDILVSVGDVADEVRVDEIVQRHLDKFGRIDIMVNCAGIAGPTELIEHISLADWSRCIAVNLNATYLFCRAVIPAMRRAKSGNIINISSTAGWHGYPLRTAYASAKWAILGLTKSLAMELGPAGIRVNAICPGSIQGDRMDRVIAAEAQKKGVGEQEIRDIYTQSCSLRTFIDASDIANMALFIASDSAQRVTGQILNVDGHLENPGTLNL